MKNNIAKITILIIYFSIVFSAMMLLTKISVYFYFYLTRGIFYLSINDAISSTKAGIAAGVPIGFGSWFLKK